ncbi:MAG: lysophospholipid acyltransferase family protein [Thermodesulfobacteriota bacterium]
MLSLFSRFISILPLWAALALGRFIGFIWYYIIPVRKKLAFENIKRALGDELSEKEQKKIIRRFFSNFCMSLMEVLRIPHMSLADNEKLVKIEGWEHVEKALERGKGVILFATHIDNVDLAGCSMAMRGAPISVVVRKMGKSAEQFISSVRENTGVTIIPGKNSKNYIRELLAENKIVTIVADQHLAKRRSIVCKFFGQWASTTPAPSRFAFETDAAIIPGVFNRQGKTGYHVARISPAFEQETPYDDMDMNIRHNTERLNRIIEQWIREAPDQWWWVHKRWKVQDDPEGWDIPPDNTESDQHK